MSIGQEKCEAVFRHARFAREKFNGAHTRPAVRH